jgi:hypothetical protein
MGDSFFGVYYSIAVFFNFNDRACVLIVDKLARDWTARSLSECQVNDVIQCLVWDIAGCPVADEMGGALGLIGWSGWCTIPFIIRFNNGKGVSLLLGIGQ